MKSGGVELATLALLGGLVLALVWLIVEVQKVREAVEPIANGSLGRFLASV